MGLNAAAAREARAVTRPTTAARVVAVAGAGATNIKTTAALNLAVAFAAAGVRTELRDLDPAGAATLALGGAPATVDGAPAPRDVRLAPLAPGSLTLTSGWGDVAAPTGTPAPPGPALTLLDCPPRLDAATTRALAVAHLVLVPVDGSPLALRVLRELSASASDEQRSRLRAVLTRLLPRRVDRWAVLEELSDGFPGTLYATTVPMGRTGAARGGDRARTATLFAPTTRAARAYAALAREVAADVGLAL
jgi:cellulose biosynthesis protein BcsQ